MNEALVPRINLGFDYPERLRVATRLHHEVSAFARAFCRSYAPGSGRDEFNSLVKSVARHSSRAILREQPLGTTPASGMVNSTTISKTRLSSQKLWLVVTFVSMILYTDGTILNEDPEAPSRDEANFNRIKINEFGAYTQIAKNIWRLKFTGSIRFDKTKTSMAR